MTTERTEDYLEVIDVIMSEKEFAQVKVVSKLLGVGQSSVTEMFQKLSEMGLINYEKYSGVTLTLYGKKIAKKQEKLTIFLKFFNDPWYQQENC